MSTEHLAAQISQKVIFSKDGRIFLVQDRKQRFELPGGRLHVNEEPLSGLRREIQEELNCDLRHERPVTSFVFTGASGTHYFTLIYVAETVGEPSPEQAIEQGEILSAGWFSATDIEKLPILAQNRAVLQDFFAGRLSLPNP